MTNSRIISASRTGPAHCGVLAAAVAGALVMGVVVAPPAGAVSAASVTASASQPSAKARAPKIVKKRVSGTTTGQGKVKYSFVKPILKGSTAKNRKAFNTRVDKTLAKLLSGWVKAERRNPTRCSDAKYLPQVASLRTTRADAAIYQGRYASVGLSLDGGVSCDPAAYTTIRSFTIDLTTGKAVSLDKVVANPFKVLDWAVVARLTEDERDNAWRPRGSGTGALYKWAGWSVSNDGLRLYWDGPDDHWEGKNVFVPWSAIPRPSEATGKVQTAKWILRSVGGTCPLGNDKPSADGVCATVTLRAKGNAVEFSGGILQPSDWVGVRRASNAVVTPTFRGTGHPWQTLHFSDPAVLSLPDTFGPEWEKQ
ncbi:MAG: hypothetical protein FWD59_00685 [Micrococcales bacterium]|nr:hypothetical protein [Micrococcales bacterium]